MFRYRILASMLGMLMIMISSPSFAQLIFEDTFPGSEGGPNGLNARWAIDAGSGSISIPGGGGQVDMTTSAHWDQYLSTQGGTEGPYNRTNGGNVLQLTVDSTGMPFNFMMIGFSSVGGLPAGPGSYNIGHNGAFLFARPDSGNSRFESPGNGPQRLPGEGNTGSFEIPLALATSQAFSVRITAGSIDGFLIEVNPDQGPTWETFGDFRNSGLYAAGGSADAHYDVTLMLCGNSTSLTRVRLEHVAPTAPPPGPFFDDFNGVALGADWGTIPNPGNFSVSGGQLTVTQNCWDNALSTEGGFGALPRNNGLDKVLQVRFLIDSHGSLQQNGLMAPGGLAASPNYYGGTTGIFSFTRSDTDLCRMEDASGSIVAPGEVAVGGDSDLDNGPLRVVITCGFNDGGMVQVDSADDGTLVTIADTRNLGTHDASSNYGFGLIGPCGSNGVYNQIHAMYVDDPQAVPVELSGFAID
jgi:hypothetical protein